MAVILGDKDLPIPLLFDETLIPKIKMALERAGPELTYMIVAGCIKNTYATRINMEDFNVASTENLSKLLKNRD